jgi:hypothetical protein
MEPSNAMNALNVDLQFSHQIDQKIKAGFKSLLQMVLDHAPSDSYCRALMTKGEDKFRVLVLIRSQEATFLSQEVSTSPQALLESIRNDLMDQIRRWRRVREISAAVS